ncbi:pseudaminic acid synthase [Nocardioides aromaticivorans]|uniref:Pseudaminic acid synthase n=1 Tax=Nocardioides aromaticivorans TaxID=200618 RepID=A0ABX7PPN8_9ACTN|nr:pseudaminic acid synthase [Nocardioides aromaticivorans]QSR27841.1 pseudaminic acid synthase [Nocardioides aromaticivorans]
MNIGGIPVGRDADPFVIAEISGNHHGSLDRALAIVDSLAGSGVHAVKLQTYTADTMTIDVDREEFTIQNPGSLWYGRTLHDLYSEAMTPWEWHEPIMARAREHGMLCFSSPFDRTAVDFLLGLDVPCFKIASSEIIDIPLIRCTAATGKPLIISTGMATLEEIEDAVAAAREGGCEDLVLLKCTTSYPARPEDSHLLTIPDLRERFGCEVGLSDHSLGVGVAVAAVALGAVVLEKHITLDRNDGAVDSPFSLEPPEFAQLVTETAAARVALGEVRYQPTEAEEGARGRRRSLYLVEDVAAGEVLTEQNLRSIRPGSGLPPKHWDEVLGRRVRESAPRGTPLTWDLLAD